MSNVEHATKDASVANEASATTFRNVIQIDEEQVRSHVDEVVRTTVEATLNSLLEAEADELCGARRYCPCDGSKTLAFRRNL